MTLPNKTLTVLEGVRVGHHTQTDKLTGATVVTFDRDLPVAYKSYGGGAGTFNTEMLQNGSSFYHRYGLFIAGGSLGGLTASASIHEAMVQDKVGFKAANIYNPSISGAIVFDLGTHIAQFDAGYGAMAYQNRTKEPVASGNVGAGTGTSVGKFSLVSGLMAPMKAGVGSGFVELENGIIVTAMSIVNAVGNVVENGNVLAGNRDGKGGFAEFPFYQELGSEMNTTISIVGTNVKLPSREHYERVAHMGTHGQVRAINPVHMSVDGDTVFAFSTETHPGLVRNLAEGEYDSWKSFNTDAIGQLAARVVEQSIHDAVRSAKSISFSALDGIVPGLAS